jgi:hypothetical protein
MRRRRVQVQNCDYLLRVFVLTVPFGICIVCCASFCLTENVTPSSREQAEKPGTNWGDRK